MPRAEFLKQGTPQALAYEAASSEWLDQANGARIVKVLRHDHTRSHLKFLEDGFQPLKAAHELGTALAAAYAAGVPGWGAAPPTWDSEQAFKGLMPVSVVPVRKDFPYQSFETWLNAQHLQPVAEAATKHGDLPPKLMARFKKLYHVLQTGEFDSPQPQLVKTLVARLHGDLWAGDLCWTRPGVVLIDPDVHGGHAETDLAECEVFSTPHINEIYAGYQSVSPLSPGWKERLSLRQLYMMTLHLALFGGGYLHAVSRILQQYTQILFSQCGSHPLGGGFMR